MTSMRDGGFDSEAVPAVVITSKGMATQNLSIREALRLVKSDLTKVFYLVRLSLHQQVFGLTLGHFWHLLEPALEACCYYILIAVVFKAAGHDASFAFFFASVTLWKSHAALVVAGPTFFVARATQYIQSSLPLRMAYLEMIAGEFLLFLIRLLMLGGFLLAAGVPLAWTWVLVIPIAIVMFTFSAALAVWLSIFGLVFRDLGKFVGHAVWFWWYLSPGLYSISRVPDWAEPFYSLNPFAAILPALHSALLVGAVPENTVGLGIVWLASLVGLFVGGKLVKRSAYQLYRDL